MQAPTWKRETCRTRRTATTVGPLYILLLGKHTRKCARCCYVYAPNIYAYIYVDSHTCIHLCLFRIDVLFKYIYIHNTFRSFYIYALTFTRKTRTEPPPCTTRRLREICLWCSSCWKGAYESYTHTLRMRIVTHKSAYMYKSVYISPLRSQGVDVSVS